MSQQDTIFGRIDVMKLKDTRVDTVASVLASLPEHDDFPPLCRSMFAVAAADVPSASFRGERAIAFAFTGNHAAGEIASFLPKFESLLSRLPWYRAVICVRPEYPSGFDVEYLKTAGGSTPTGVPWEIRCRSASSGSLILHRDIASRPGYCATEWGQPEAAPRDAAAALLQSIDWLLAFNERQAPEAVRTSDVLRRAFRDSLRECREKAAALAFVTRGEMGFSDINLFVSLSERLATPQSTATRWEREWQYAATRVQEVRDRLRSSPLLADSGNC
jgi:hypothetical protein